jgi:hypothetical protein
MLFVTFGNRSYESSQKLIVCEARNTGLFRKVLADPLGADFMSAHGNFVNSNQRGYGYWIWKPYIILRALETECEEGEALVYADSGCSFGTTAQVRIPQWVQIAEEHPSKMVTFEIKHPEFEWTKMDTIQAIYPDIDVTTYQIEATKSVFINNEKTRAFVREWYDWCSKDNYHYLTDAKSSVVHPQFIDHRHDQSIFSLLVKKNGVLHIPDEGWPPHDHKPLRSLRRKKLVRIFFNAFWPNFGADDQVNVKFFLTLFEKAFGLQCEPGGFYDSDVLCESLFGPSALLHKNWKMAFLYSGESRFRENWEKYTLVLGCKYSSGNIVNVPFFVPYLWCKGEALTQAHRADVPPKDTLVVISQSPPCKLALLELLHSEGVDIVYGGPFRHNSGDEFQKARWGSPEFDALVSQYKFVFACENSREETYVTEKICHGFTARVVPLYWGCENVGEYFNEERFINFNKPEEALGKLREVRADTAKWLEMVNRPIVKKQMTIDVVALEIQRKCDLNTL